MTSINSPHGPIVCNDLASAQSLDATSSDEEKLPALRQDLQIQPAAPNPRGARNWLIYDPLRHRYFSVGATEVHLLKHWDTVTRTEVLQRVNTMSAEVVTEDALNDLVFFLHANGLIDESSTESVAARIRQIAAGQRSLLARVIHGYLFVRIPLVRPHRFLQATASLAAPFFNRWIQALIALTGAIGIYLTSRQWDVFTATFMEFLSLEGLAVYGVALIAIKLLHELGHAYSAERHGVRVTTMGIAFMVMMPLLYTDVTGAWALQSRRKRLQIAAAGVCVELGLACIATCLWAFLPDGPVRSAAFVVATSSWVLSIVINLNPFMKFDGYHLMTDGFAIPNLQDRAFALARWRLREALFGLRARPPEPLEPHVRRNLIAFGVGVWIYRLFLFIGIALLVYVFFFKALGFILFAIEIAWFIALPIAREIGIWCSLREQIMQRTRTYMTTGLVFALLALMAVPFRWSVTLPAIVTVQSDVAVFAPEDARVVTSNFTEGRQVRRGEQLAAFVAPDLDHRIEQNRLSLTLLEARLARIAGDAADLATRTTIESEYAARQAEHDGLMRQKRQLTIVARSDGTVRDLDPAFHVGAWHPRTRPIARIIDPSRLEGRAYINEEDIWRLKTGRQGRFIPDDPLLNARTVVVSNIGSAGVETIDTLYLASVHGGPIPSERDDGGQIRPRRSQYRVRFDVDGELPTRVVRGVVRLPGEAQSVLSIAWRRIARVLIRESGL